MPVRPRPRPRERHAPLLVSVDEAARLLGISRDTFDRRVMDEIKLVTIGRRLLVPVDELRAYIDAHKAAPLADDLARLLR